MKQTSLQGIETFGYTSHSGQTAADSGIQDTGSDLRTGLSGMQLWITSWSWGTGCSQGPERGAEKRALSLPGRGGHPKLFRQNLA